ERPSQVWRRERDSNPRGAIWPPNGLANRPLRPLGYLSAFQNRCGYYLNTETEKMSRGERKLVLRRTGFYGPLRIGALTGALISPLSNHLGTQCCIKTSRHI